MHELLDTLFGHPVLTVAYYELYKYFLKGVGTAALGPVFARRWRASLPTASGSARPTHRPCRRPTCIKLLTGVHGKLLSRQSLLTFHDQGREGVDRVEKTYHEIEATFLRGADRQNAPLLFFSQRGLL